MNSVIDAVNNAEPDAARQAFANLRELIAERRTELRIEEARLNHAEATLLYAFEVSKAEPLLCAAAYLADQEFSYWIDCGAARMRVGDLKAAQAAFDTASNLTAETPNGRDAMVAKNWIGDVHVSKGELSLALQVYEAGINIARDLAARDPGNADWARDVSVSLIRVGDVRRAQGDLPGALTVYDESLQIRRDLAARDPGNAGWARDVWVSYWKMAQIDTENSAQYWAEVVTRMEDMHARGILLRSDLPFLEQARENLSAAQ